MEFGTFNLLITVLCKFYLFHVFLPVPYHEVVPCSFVIPYLRASTMYVGTLVVDVNVICWGIETAFDDMFAIRM